MKSLPLINKDPWLKPFEGELTHQLKHFRQKLDSIFNHSESLVKYANNHHHFGLHLTPEGWIFREWAPNASAVFMVGEFSNWKVLPEYELHKNHKGEWEAFMPHTAIKHGDKYKLLIKWSGGEGYRIPTYANRVVQDATTLIYDAQVWALENDFEWTDQTFEPKSSMPLIYEAHIGMSSEEEKVSTFNEFTENILPRIHELGYNTIQLMAIQEHPYYGSFGYHVSNYFAVSSRFGTPRDLKHLINKAHALGILVIMDIVHSHSVKNELEGLSLFDGTDHVYFHSGPKGNHPAWDSRLFDYGKDSVIKFLLSNCRYWLEEFHFDGFRFDGVTSMIYHDHGLEKNFIQYSDYFNGACDLDAITYLTLANKLIHEIKPNALSIAEEMSGYPGLACKIEDGGVGFDMRLSMGVPDLWIKLIKEVPDESWNVSLLYHELTQHRIEEKIISYAESHDQALVGDKTIIFRLADKEMYDNMSTHFENLVIDRAIALHKIIRLITMTTSNGGYLTFMGNEFGHPEWIDFPRAGNNSSYKYARRQWSLADHKDLKYKFLNRFDKAMIDLADKNKLLSQPIWKHFDNTSDQVLAFSRGYYLFVYNFNPEKSFTDYGIPVSAGKYAPVLSTDQEEFGGFNRTDMNYIYYSQPKVNSDEHHQLLLYLPSRTAMVLKQLPIKRVY